MDLFAAKKEGESCGSCMCPPTFSAGECEEGLTCVHDELIADAPGVCTRKGRRAIFAELFHT